MGAGVRARVRERQIRERAAERHVVLVDPVAERARRGLVLSQEVSLDHPETLEEGMVFALETYWPAADGWSAARIEEEVVVTANGCEVITKFPAEELLVAGRKYWTAGGQLNTVREAQSHLNTGKGAGDDGAR